MTLSVDGKVQILNEATAAVAGASYRMNGGGLETVEAYGTTSSGTGAAIIEIQVSNNGSTWQTAGTINLNLRDTRTSDSFTMDASWIGWLYVRANVASITGTGASVSVYKTTGAGSVGTLQTHTSEHSDMGVAGYNFKRDYKTKPFTVLDDMSSAATNWNNARTGCTLSDDTTIIREENEAVNALKVTISAAYARFQRQFGSAVTITGTVNVWVYFDSDPTPGMTFEVYFTSDYTNFATKYIKWYYPGDTYLRKGWNCLSLNTADDGTKTWATITSGGAEAWTNAMNGIKIIANGLATGQVFRIGGVFWGGEARANVLVNLDDGASSQWTAFNIFRARGIPISLSIITSKIGLANYLTWNQLDQMYAWGCDIIPHSVTHPAGGLDASTLSEATYELSQSRATLLEHGYARCADIFAWPQNDYVSSVGVDLIGLAASLGYKLTRGSTRRDLPTAQGIDNPMRLPSADIGGRTLAQVTKILDAAELYKQTNILYGHRLVGTATSPASGGTPPPDGLEWYWSDFVALADDIASRYTAGTLTPITYSNLKSECRY